MVLLGPAFQGICNRYISALYVIETNVVYNEVLKISRPDCEGMSWL